MAVVIVVIVIVAIWAEIIYWYSSPPSAKVTVEVKPLGEDRWKECKPYVITVRISVDLGDSYFVKVAEVVVFLRELRTYAVVQQNSTNANMNWTIGMTGVQREITLVIHPQKGLLTERVCDSFQIEARASVQIYYERLGIQRLDKMEYSIPVQVQICS